MVVSAQNEERNFTDPNKMGKDEQVHQSPPPILQLHGNKPRQHWGKATILDPNWDYGEGQKPFDTNQPNLPSQQTRLWPFNATY